MAPACPYARAATRAARIGHYGRLWPRDTLLGTRDKG